MIEEINERQARYANVNANTRTALPVSGNSYIHIHTSHLGHTNSNTKQKQDRQHDTIDSCDIHANSTTARSEIYEKGNAVQVATVVADNSHSQYASSPMGKQEQEDNNGEEFHYNDSDIRRDAATQNVSIMVHMALTFFAALLIISLIMLVVLVGQFGLVALLTITVLGFFFLGMAWLVNSILKEDTELKPARRKIKRWRALGVAVVLQEIRNFQLDWHEGLMLTDGTEYQEYLERDHQAGASAMENTTPKIQESYTYADSNRSRSMVFGLIVQPFLKVKGFRKKRKEMRKEERQKEQRQQNNDGAMRSNKDEPAANECLPPDGTHF